MAAPARATSGNVGLDVNASPIAADQLSAELSEWADRIESEAGQENRGRIVEARVRALRRHAGQFARLARSTEQDGDA